MEPSPSKRSLKDAMRRAWKFATEEVWDVELSSLPSVRSLGVRAVRVVNLVFRGFLHDQCPLHASALTFSTLMAIVPVLALSLAVARGLGDEQTIKLKIRGVVTEWTQTFGGNGGAVSAGGAGTEEGLSPTEFAAQVQALVDRGFEKVENISFAAISGVGLVFLIWMVIAVLGQVEASFNGVWGLRGGRSLWRRFTDYLSVILILPVLIVAASSIPVASFIDRVLGGAGGSEVQMFLGSVILKKVTVVGMTTLCFTFLLMFMPNTRVRLGPGLAGGLVAALLFLAWLWICAALQLGVARYGKIYGSFAVVPILLAWVYVSWGIVLFGAEIAYAVQNCSSYQMEQGARRANVQARVLLALSVIVEAARDMLGKAEGFDTSSFARKKLIPVRLLNDVVEELVAAGLMAGISEQKSRFVLLKAPESLRVGDIVDVVMRSGVHPEGVGLGGIDPALRETVQQVMKGLRSGPSEKTVRDLIRSAS